MPSLTISFAIPTYNFGPYIKETVDSIFKGMQPLTHEQLQVVIVDGASTDSTELIVAQLQKNYPSILYERRGQRGGIDFDLNHAVSLCRHEYVWMLSSDDVLDKGWGQSLCAALTNVPVDLILAPATLCDINMQVMRRNRIFDVVPEAGALVTHFAESSAVSSYLSNALTLEALFSYMSSVIVRKASWDSLQERPDYYRSCWAHCARLMPLVTEPMRRAKILYLNDFILLKRSGNDSFMEHGLIRRIGITVDGWDRILREFFKDLPAAYDQALRLWLRDASIVLFVYAKLGALSAAQSQEVIRMAQLIFGQRNDSSSKLKLLLIRCTPSWPRCEKLLRVIVPQLIFWRHKIKGLFH
jgi:abequosyltransferase